MNFGNNIEAMGFEKSGWSLIETSANGKTIYMGKPTKPDAKPEDPVWLIKMIFMTENKDGSTTVEIKYTETSRNKWSDRASLIYKYF